MVQTPRALLRVSGASWAAGEADLRVSHRHGQADVSGQHLAAGAADALDHKGFGRVGTQVTVGEQAADHSAGIGIEVVGLAAGPLMQKRPAKFCVWALATIPVGQRSRSQVLWIMLES